ncbi:hypothetical protein FA13DRAFT_351831 [Coprinellus micaceus]|uniref:Uncharacterized protein n=1 Tax=Coprinellus micaceus TaxID=71717 RepID=A0A4Y7TCC1_COPMI|nr:hypothetical protein FA13DRAFT_351831 [Coprinellus micaceus]
MDGASFIRRMQEMGLAGREERKKCEEGVLKEIDGGSATRLGGFDDGSIVVGQTPRYAERVRTYCTAPHQSLFSLAALTPRPHLGRGEARDR